MLKAIPVLILLCLAVNSRADKDQWIWLPVVANAPETGFMVGLYATKLEASDDEGVPGNRYSFLVSGTSEGMYMAQVWPTWWLNANQSVTVGFGLNYWPGTYYENGNSEPKLEEEYESTNEVVRLSFDQRLVSELWIKLQWTLQWSDISSDDDNDLINDKTPGSDGGFYHGLGATLTWDKTDSRDFPRSGQKIEAGSTGYFSALGSAEQFMISEVSAMQYVPVLSDSTLAFKATYMTATDDTPFNKLPAPEGSSILRGANSAKFADYELLGVQGELRWVFSDRWGMDLFSDFAQVAPDFGKFGMNRFHNATGVGVRYNLAKGTRLNFRVDLALVDGEDIGTVVSFEEAF
ncbi:BamA/TamA family outer membrane protein [Gynuella sunshinyii]|uniref:Outer membrane protein n=1 Tax=Gynuella sunshinyii YC6258 TaxID=1445510 RepID=A0A0C5V496_9GAMM|nr:BamA/TamA family outer membrane protein [Gynuella sunshinyii]AJQ94285.1 outer membrane protein [Gynuella sunshinyii YC6258]